MKKQAKKIKIENHWLAESSRQYAVIAKIYKNCMIYSKPVKCAAEIWG
jgi:hypothetical protein